MFERAKHATAMTRVIFYLPNDAVWRTYIACPREAQPRGPAGFGTLVDGENVLWCRVAVLAYGLEPSYDVNTPPLVRCFLRKFPPTGLAFTLRQERPRGTIKKHAPPRQDRAAQRLPFYQHPSRHVEFPLLPGSESACRTAHRRRPPTCLSRAPRPPNAGKRFQPVPRFLLLRRRAEQAAAVGGGAPSRKPVLNDGPPRLSGGGWETRGARWVIG